MGTRCSWSSGRPHIFRKPICSAVPIRISAPYRESTACTSAPLSVKNSLIASALKAGGSRDRPKNCRCQSERAGARVRHDSSSEVRQHVPVEASGRGGMTVHIQAIDPKSLAKALNNGGSDFTAALRKLNGRFKRLSTNQEVVAGRSYPNGYSLTRIAKSLNSGSYCLGVMILGEKMTASKQAADFARLLSYVLISEP
jgi:hypothetical protein